MNYAMNYARISEVNMFVKQFQQDMLEQMQPCLITICITEKAVVTSNQPFLS